MIHDAKPFLAMIRRGNYEAVGVLGDWLQEHGDPRGEKLLAIYHRCEKHVRYSCTDKFRRAHHRAPLENISIAIYFTCRKAMKLMKARAVRRVLYKRCEDLAVDLYRQRRDKTLAHAEADQGNE